MPPRISHRMLVQLLVLVGTIASALAWQSALATPLEAFIRVERGDTLFGIARRYGTTVQRIREVNGLQGDLIRPGQRLKLGGSGVRAQRSSALRLADPLQGQPSTHVLRGFGNQRDERFEKVVQRHTGLDLAAREGAAIQASDAGVVRFLGEVPGFGRLLILDHDGGWRTVYCPLQRDGLDVELGEVVARGQRLGRLGAPVESESSALHFELRKGDEAVDPNPHRSW